MERLFEKSAKKPEFVRRIEILNNTDWTFASHEPYILVAVSEGSIEHSNVKFNFESSARGSKVSKIERVENPFLRAQFLLKKQQMNMNNSSAVNEKTLYHGTKESNIDGICKMNFNWRLNGQSRGHKFGQGVSFSPLVSYAKHYSPWEDRVIIRCKVLTCRTIFGNINTVVPPEGYDTTSNGKDTVFVKYEDDDFYPEYIIHYD